MKRLALPLLLASACAQTDLVDDTQTSFLGESAAIFPASSCAVLLVVNIATEEALDITVPLDVRAAKAIVAYRKGADGKPGTADDVTIDTLAELDAIAYVGPAALAALEEYVDGLGLSCGPPPPVPQPPAGSLELLGNGHFNDSMGEGLTKIVPFWMMTRSHPPFTLVGAVISSPLEGGGSGYQFDLRPPPSSNGYDIDNMVEICNRFQIPPNVVGSLRFTVDARVGGGATGNVLVALYDVQGLGSSDQLVHLDDRDADGLWHTYEASVPSEDFAGSLVDLCITARNALPAEIPAHRFELDSLRLVAETL
jgi:hypothetical protein